MYIKGLHQEPEKSVTSKVTETERRHLKLAVFVSYGKKPICFVTQSSSCPGLPPSDHTPRDNKGLATKEYLYFLKELDRQVVIRCATRKRARKERVLVHDRASFHKSKEFQEGARRLGWEPILLPPKGCDISPLDTSYFGVAKQKWLMEYRWKEGGARPPPWEVLGKGFVECLLATSPDNHIISVPGRIARCIKFEGGHIH